MATDLRPEVRISVRVDPDLADSLKRVADDRFEGRLSMAAREAFRRLITDGESSKQPAEKEPVAA